MNTKFKKMIYSITEEVSMNNNEKVYHVYKNKTGKGIFKELDEAKKYLLKIK